MEKLIILLIFDYFTDFYSNFILPMDGKKPDEKGGKLYGKHLCKI